VREFYERALGLALIRDGSSDGCCVFESAGIEIVVEAVARDAAEEDRACVGRFTGVSFVVTDIAEACADLAARGVRFSTDPEKQPWGGWLATFTDPSGNELQLVQYPDWRGAGIRVSRVDRLPRRRA